LQRKTGEYLRAPQTQLNGMGTRTRILQVYRYTALACW